MAGARSHRFFGPRALPIGSTVLYTVPAGFVARMTLLRVANAGAAGAAMFFSVNTALPGSQLTPAITVPANGTFSDLGPIVLAAGEVLYVTTFAATTVAVSGHGSLLIA